MSELQPLEDRYGGGFNLADSPDQLGPNQSRLQENFRLDGRGWISTRKSSVELSAPDGDVVAAIPYDHTGGVGSVLLVWDDAGELVELWTVDGSGGTSTLIGTVPGYEMGISARPTFSYAVLGRVLFFCDVTKSRGMVAYDPNDVFGGATHQVAFTSGSELPTLGATLDGATSAASAVFERAYVTSGSWGGGDAAGTLYVRGITGTFVAENIDINGGTANVLAIAGAPTASPPMFQPTFDFDDDSTFAVALPRVLVEHENHIWMFGYGDEADLDRGEVGRFSYLGLLNDSQGQGDAGTGGATGSMHLFDQTDAVPMAPRGENVVAAKSGNGRLVVATEKQASVIYGTGRDTWKKDDIDTQRGCVSTAAMVEADGVVWWLSLLGLVRYRGGARVEDLSRLMQPLMDVIDFDSVFAAHHASENQVRWYYRLKTDTVAGADRWFGVDYQIMGFVSDILGYRVFCAGELRPSGVEGPAAAPSSLTHDQVTHQTARATWVPGDTSPGTRTVVDRQNVTDGGSYFRVALLGSGAGEYRHTGLLPEKQYNTRISHIRNGQVSTLVVGSFTTELPSFIPAVNGLAAEDAPALTGQGIFSPGVLVSWSFDIYPGGLKAQLERNIDGAGWIRIAEGLGIGATSYRDEDVTAGIPLQYRVTAENTVEATSAVSGSASVTPTVDPYDNWPEGVI